MKNDFRENISVLIGILITFAFLVLSLNFWYKILILSEYKTTAFGIDDVAAIIGTMATLISGGATFNSWMRNLKNFFMAQLIFQTFEYNSSGPINKNELELKTQEIFESIKMDLRQRLNDMNFLKKFGYKITHIRELRQKLHDFDTELYNDAKQRLRFEGYICYCKSRDEYYWRNTICLE